MEERLTVLTSFDDFISCFTEPIATDDENVKRTLEDLMSHKYAALDTPLDASTRMWLGHESFEGTRIGNGIFESIRFQTWLFPPSTVIRRVSESAGHRIGGSEWYTATVDFILVGIVQPVASISSIFNPVQGDISAVVQIACQWRAKVLFSVGQHPEFTLVEWSRPKAVDPREQAEVQPLIDKASAASGEQALALYGALFAWAIQPITED
jgi:hypothetical protein